MHDYVSRRQMLAGATVAAAGMLGTSRLMAAKQSPATRPAGAPDNRQRGQGEPLPAFLKTSLCAYSFRDSLDKLGKPGKMSLLDFVDYSARLGVDAVELTSYYFLRLDDEYIYDLKRRVYLAGLGISGSPTSNNFCKKPGPELDKEIAHVREWVDVAVKLGAPTVRVFTGSAVSGISREKAFENVVAGLKEAGRYAGDHGIFLALENHHYLVETADNLLRIIDAVDHPWVGVNLDTGNFHERAYENIAKAAPKAVTCQIKVEVRTEAGKKAPADIPRIIGILRQARYRGYVALEYESAESPATAVPKYMRQIQDAIRSTG